MQKTLNILVSFIFLISFIGVNIHKHYSQGKLYSTAIFIEAETCCEDMEHCQMADMTETCNQHQKNDCSCENETKVLKISDVFVSEKFSFLSEKVINLFSVSIFQFMETNMFLEIYNKTYSNHSPPLKQTDTQSEFGVFLI